MFLTQWFTAFLLWFVPESLREKGSGTERQAKLLVGFSAFLALSGIPFAFDAFNSQHNTTAGTLLLGGAALVGAQPFVLKYWGSLKLSGHMMMGALFAILIGLASISTGMISTSMMWAAPTPLIAVLLMGNGAGFFWTVMVSLLYTAFYILESNNIKFVPMNSNEGIHFDWYISLVGLSALVYILSRLYEQSRREALDELAEANKAKSFYLANMSHEIRTPLNAIIGYSELMLEDAEDYELPTLQEDLNKVHISGKNLLALINDVLDLSKIEAGKMEVFLEDIEINHLVEEIEVTTHPLAQKNNNTLQIKVQTERSKYRADRSKLRQSLLNLLSNACKFTEEGTVTLTISEKRKDGKEWFSFLVQDTGIGMSEEQCAKVFTEYTQANKQTQKDYGGTGLGLPISKGFCEIMGGDITVASMSGQGTTFEMLLPLDIQEQKQH